MTKTPRTMRIDDELFEEVKKVLVRLRPKETFTQFVERAVWERLKKAKPNQGATKKNTNHD